MEVPNHVGIIMDGNGRWAKKRGLPRTFGHKKGAEVTENVIEWSRDLGVRYLTLYSFSTENWKRPQDEVGFLMNLFAEYLQTRIRKIISNRIRMRFSGRIDGLPEELRKICYEVAEESKNNTELDVILCLNYGGRHEVLDAVNKAIKDGVKEITEETISKYLYCPDVPEPDLIVRTSGEVRTSNFLLWESAYSEYYFTDILWPDLTYDKYVEILSNYKNRERRYGGIR